ncbi:DDE-type integrase/transposase/recombinase [Myxococcus xanthus]|uniref:integrase core domain-containing protein n=1 Tax=Myxococcus xanthus TaxID=34 RepID=UPI00191735A6|nr:DDE-type integrase/transposase/recombinase [Myxococcus xanthus]
MAETLEARFGPGAAKAPLPVVWLSDNGPTCTVKDTRNFGQSLGLRICTTPAYSSQGNGMAGAFVKTFKRDDVSVNELPSAAHVMVPLPAWFDDDNRCHPHRGLTMKSPREFRTANSLPRAVRFDGATPESVPSRPDDACRETRSPARSASFRSGDILAGRRCRGR